MSTETAVRPPSREANADDGLAQLVEALKVESGLTEQPVEDVAARFGLEPAVVESVIGELAEPQGTSRQSIDILRLVRSLFRMAARGVRDAWLSATDSPYVFIVVAFAVMGVLQAILARYPGREIADRLENFVLLGAILAILGCIARWGKPMVAGFAALLTFLLEMGIAFFGRPAPSTLPVSPLAAGLFLAFGTSSVVLLFGIVAAFIGHAVREAKSIRKESRLTRQELLDRAFELQSRFDQGRHERTEASAMDQVAAAFREHGQYPAVAMVMAMAVGCFRVAVISSVPMVGSSEVHFAWNVLFSTISALFLLAVGYWAPTPRLALSSMLIAFVGVVLPTGLPRQGYGHRVVIGYVTSSPFWIVLGLVVVAGLIIGEVLKANRAEMRRRRVKSNDTSAVAAEIVRTHWRLYGRQRSLIVLVVDVAGSTLMKAGADPGRVEYSFRAYQEMISSITTEHGGKVINTAGDGAVCSFTDAASAMTAARELQTRLSEFNSSVNRLGSPFRIRIGLHAGESGVDLAHAPFNALIDVAAHVEKVAPVGGIAVTDSVADRVPNEGLVELAAKVDGHRVSVVLNPTRTEA